MRQGETSWWSPPRSCRRCAITHHFCPLLRHVHRLTSDRPGIRPAASSWNCGIASWPSLAPTSHRTDLWASAVPTISRSPAPMPVRALRRKAWDTIKTERPKPIETRCATSSGEPSSCHQISSFIGILACRRGCLCRRGLVGRAEGVVPEGGRLRCQNLEASFQVWRRRKQEAPDAGNDGQEKCGSSH